MNTSANFLTIKWKYFLSTSLFKKRQMEKNQKYFDEKHNNVYFNY